MYVRAEVKQFQLTQAEVPKDVAHGQLVSAERAQRGGVGAEADPGAVDAVDRAEPLAEARQAPRCRPPRRPLNTPEERSLNLRTTTAKRDEF